MQKWIKSEKTSKTQEVQVDLMHYECITIMVVHILVKSQHFRPTLKNLILQGLLKELRTKVTESDLGEDESVEEVAGPQAAGAQPERPCYTPIDPCNIAQPPL